MKFLKIVLFQGSVGLAPKKPNNMHFSTVLPSSLKLRIYPWLSGSGGEEESFVKLGFTPYIPLFKGVWGPFPGKVLNIYKCRKREKPSNTFLPNICFMLILYIFISH